MPAVASPPASRSDLLFENLLEEVRFEVDAALDEIRQDEDRARLIATRDLRFEPDKAVLAVVIEIAKAPAPEGPARELPRRLLALRVLAARELGAMFAGTSLSAERIRRGTVVVSAVLVAARPLHEAVRIETGSESGHRKRLLAYEKALAVPTTDLCSALLLAPRLAEFARITDEASGQAVAPTLVEGEARRIANFVARREGSCGDAHRSCIDALALRTLMDEDMARAEAVLACTRIAEAGAPAGISDAAAAEDAPGAAERGGVAVGDDRSRAASEADAAELRAVLARLDAERVAYDFVSSRLQQQQNLALQASLRSLVEELGFVARGLFSSYRRLVALSREAGRVHAETTVDLQAIWADADGVDGETERQVGRETSEEACARTVRELRGGETRQVRGLAAGADPARRPRRVVPLVVVALLLAGASAWFHMGRTEVGGPEKLSYTDFPAALSVSEFAAAGTMMYVQVNGWGQLDTVQRRTRVEILAEAARRKGYSTLYVTDDDGFPAAAWSATEGARLLDPRTGAEPRR